VITLAVAFIAPSYLRAQAVGQILGTIKDPTGAVVPNAKITVLQEGTGGDTIYYFHLVGHLLSSESSSRNL